LIDAGANKDVATKEGWTPLSAATFDGHAEAVKVLLDNGAFKEPVLKSNGAKPLYLACEKNRPECVRHLLAGGADKN
jgi:ankyrin repeat protein